MSGVGRLNKTFNSLDRKRRSIRGSVQPINTLDQGDKEIKRRLEGPTKNTRDHLEEIFGTQVDNSKKLRRQIKSSLDNTEHQHSSSSSKWGIEGPDSNTKTFRDRIRQKNYLSSGDSSDDKYWGEIVPLKKVLMRRQELTPTDSLRLNLHLLDRQDGQVFISQNFILEISVVLDTQLRKGLFGDDYSLLMELKDNLGFIYVEFESPTSRVLTYFQRYCHNVVEILEAKDVKNEVNKLIPKNMDSERRPKGREHNFDPFDMPTIDPQLMYRGTRQSSRLLQGDTDNKKRDDTNSMSLTRNDQTLFKEDFDKFDGDLKYKFTDNTTFTLTFSDFRTLYNNEWINDSLIDFFIKYEIEKVVHDRKLFSSSDIFAFNSFFFTRLVHGEDKGVPVDYYGNVKRWLNKVDIMKYPNIVIPVNENSHWYCCIIKGLPTLLDSLLQRKSEEEAFQDRKLHNEKIYGFSNGKECDSSQVNMGISHTRRTYAEVFIFDSLRQKHNNIYFPLKKFIMDYCNDKYGVNVERNDIKIFPAKVPKQSNFNDCGIHVIYNVRKWLNDSYECEKIWRSPNLKNVAKTFAAEERNNMRQELRSTLLELKTIQKSHQEKPLPLPSSKDDQSEDEIEVIEFLPERSSSAQGSQENADQKSRDSPLLDMRRSSKDREVHEQGVSYYLDKFDNTPSDLSPSKHEKNGNTPTSDVDEGNIKNRVLYEKFLDQKQPLVFRKFLNRTFLRNEAIDIPVLEEIVRLKVEIERLDPKDYLSIKKVIERFVEYLNGVKTSNYEETSTRPKDDVLVIRDNVTGKDIDKGVDKLSLSTPSEEDLLQESKKSISSSTDESEHIATNSNFLRLKGNKQHLLQLSGTRKHTTSSRNGHHEPYKTSKTSSAALKSAGELKYKRRKVEKHIDRLSSL